MTKRQRHTYIELLKRKAFRAREIKQTLLKSLIHNRNNQLKSKLIYNKQARYKLKWCGISRHLGRCLITGRARGVVRLVGLSRHSLKRYALENKVQNFKSSSW